MLSGGLGRRCRGAEASVYGVNLRSQRVLRKAGFVYEGTRRRAGFKHEEAFDILMFGLVREDLKKEE
jgi:[ribosomal protein S5]-alanine N-acetyltransferase